MRFRGIHVNMERYYALGINEETGGYVLQVVMPQGALRSRYFRLTPEEFQAWPDNRAQLDRLARSDAGRLGIKQRRPRFLYSELAQEQAEVLPNPTPWDTLVAFCYRVYDGLINDQGA